MAEDHDKEWMREDFRLSCERAERYFTLKGMSSDYKEILNEFLEEIGTENAGIEEEQMGADEMDEFASRHLKICKDPTEWRKLVYSFGRIAATAIDEKDAATAEACIGQMYHNSSRPTISRPAHQRGLSTHRETTCDSRPSIQRETTCDRRSSIRRETTSDRRPSTSGQSGSSCPQVAPREEPQPQVDIKVCLSDQQAVVVEPRANNEAARPEACRPSVRASQPPGSAAAGDKDDDSDSWAPSSPDQIDSDTGSEDERSKSRRSSVYRQQYSASETRILTQAYAKNHYPSQMEMVKLARQLCRTYRQIHKWFGNKRYELGHTRPSKPM